MEGVVAYSSLGLVLDAPGVGVLNTPQVGPPLVVLPREWLERLGFMVSESMMLPPGSASTMASGLVWVREKPEWTLGPGTVFVPEHQIRRKPVAGIETPAGMVHFVGLLILSLM